MPNLIFGCHLFVIADAPTLHCQINNKNNENYQLKIEIKDEKLKREEFKTIAEACYRRSQKTGKQLEETKRKIKKEEEECLTEMERFNSTPKPCPF